MCKKVEFSKSDEYQKYVPIVREHMIQYYEERGVAWIESEKLDHYKKCDLFTLRDNEEVGFIMFLKHDAELYLAELHIYEEYQSHGYGSQAIVWALAHAASMDFDALRVRVFSNNPAYRLYLQHGFCFERKCPHTDQLVAITHNK